MLTILTTSALRWMEDQRQRAALRRMLDRDDRTLEDVGLDREAIHEALRLPMGTALRDYALRRSQSRFILDRRA
ncbi:MAG: hypothetical protein AAF675_05820 [Pseudomonadota bacterium]